MTIDDLLSSTSPAWGLSWAFLFSYILFAEILALTGWLISRTDKKTVVYWIVGIAGLILFLYKIVGWGNVLGGGQP